ncbi:DUF3324 domain-containing protein [Erwinia sp. CPCC 100877]|nr:DUF3324 domain-containing protein [Erwinia sp. CPCC 100877]
MKQIRRWFTCLLSLLLLSLIAAPVVRADEGGGFSVTPLDLKTGEAQSSYYDLKVKPKETLQLQVAIDNSSSKEMTIQVEANNATTNDNGISSYLKEKERDSSLTVAFEDLSKVKEEKIKIPAKSTKNAVVDVTIPEEPFKGEILGGLHFTKVKTEDEEEQKSTIGTNIAYTIGVLLRESDEEITPEMAMNGVITEQRNYRNYISANLQNRAPCMIKELKAHAQVYKKGTDELCYEASNDAMRMAPNSNFNFGISLEDQKFVPGDYTMKVTGTADGTPFEFSEDFKISAEEAKEYNKNAIFVQEEGTPYWVYVMGLCGILLVGLLLFLLIKKRRGTDEE